MKNLIAIAIVVLGLGITGALGQGREAGSGLATGVKATVKKPTATVKKPKQVQPGQNSGGTISNQRTSGLSKTRKRQPNAIQLEEMIVSEIRTTSHRKTKKPRQLQTNATVKKPKQLNKDLVVNPNAMTQSEIVALADRSKRKSTSSRSSSRTRKAPAGSTSQKIEAVRGPKSAKGRTEYVEEEGIIVRTKKPSRKGSKSKRQHKP